MEAVTKKAPPAGKHGRGERMLTAYRIRRSRLTQATSYATTLAQEEGWKGYYQATLEAVYWCSPSGSDTVAHIVGDEVIIPDESEVEHEPFVLACDYKLEAIEAGEVSA